MSEMTLFKGGIPAHLRNADLDDATKSPAKGIKLQRLLESNGKKSPQGMGAKKSLQGENTKANAVVTPKYTTDF